MTPRPMDPWTTDRQSGRKQSPRQLPQNPRRRPQPREQPKVPPLLGPTPPGRQHKAHRISAEPPEEEQNGHTRKPKISRNYKTPNPVHPRKTKGQVLETPGSTSPGRPSGGFTTIQSDRPLAPIFEVLLDPRAGNSEFPGNGRRGHAFGLER